MKICQLLESWFDDDMDIDTYDEFARHLRTCKSCQKELAELKQLDGLLRRSYRTMISAYPQDTSAQEDTVAHPSPVTSAPIKAPESQAKIRQNFTSIKTRILVLAMSVFVICMFSFAWQPPESSTVQIQSKQQSELPDSSPPLLSTERVKVIGVSNEVVNDFTKIEFEPRTIAEEIVDEEEFTFVQIYQTTEFVPHESQDPSPGVF